MRCIAKLLGLTFLLNGLPTIMYPRFWMGVWERNMRDWLPEEVNSVIGEYKNLSDAAIRWIAIWEVLAGFVMLCLAGRRDEED